jgi:hypothetical protein
VDGAAVALAARVVLAAVLLIAAFAKLRRPSATRAQTVALIGARSGSAIAAVLPLVELAIAVALVVWATPVPGVVAAALLLAFTGVLLRAQVRRLPCPCFGSPSRAAPVGPAAVVRNAVLIAYAVLATGSPADASTGGALIGIAVLGAIAAAAIWAAR